MCKQTESNDGQRVLALEGKKEKPQRRLVNLMQEDVKLEEKERENVWDGGRKATQWNKKKRRNKFTARVHFNPAANSFNLVWFHVFKDTKTLGKKNSEKWKKV